MNSNLKKTLRRYYYFLRSYLPANNASIFTEVYKNNKWGGESNEFFSGEGSRNEEVVNDYVLAVSKFVRENQLSNESAVDLGCGDFTVGERISKLFARYIGVDVVEELQVHNEAIFGSDKISFITLDASKGSIPKARIVFVRQVFQHLKNEDVYSILKNVQSSGAKWLVVTEEKPLGDNYIKNPNIGTGAAVRVSLGVNGGAVDLLAKPFSLECKDANVINQSYLKDSRIETIAYNLC